MIIRKMCRVQKKGESPAGKLRADNIDEFIIPLHVGSALTGTEERVREG